MASGKNTMAVFKTNKTIRRICTASQTAVIVGLTRRHLLYTAVAAIAVFLLLNAVLYTTRSPEALYIDEYSALPAIRSATGDVSQLDTVQQGTSLHISGIDRYVELAGGTKDADSQWTLITPGTVSDPRQPPAVGDYSGTSQSHVQLVSLRPMRAINIDAVSIRFGLPVQFCTLTAEYAHINPGIGGTSYAGAVSNRGYRLFPSVTILTGSFFSNSFMPQSVFMPQSISNIEISPTGIAVAFGAVLLIIWATITMCRIIFYSYRACRDRCLLCSYCVRGLQTGHCPECGTSIPE